jgi:GT2 family glycosyltransferase
VSPVRPDLSVVVVTHNDQRLALSTLRCARACTGPLRTEWLVVDSGSTDGTPDAIEREWGDVRVLRLANVGFAAGNNAALPHAHGRYVLLLNPDVEIAAGTLHELVAALDGRPEVGAASVVQQAADGSLQPSIRRFPSPMRQLGEAVFAAHWPVLRHLQECERSPSAYDVEASAEWLVGAFLMVRREALSEIGPMDERFFLYSEEKDLCYRLRQAGWDVRHLPLMRVTHHTGRHSRADLAAQLSYAKLLFAQKHFRRPRSLAVRAALCLGHAIRLALFAPAAVVVPRLRARTASERAALAVAVGLAPPPFAGSSRPPALTSSQ